MTEPTSPPPASTPATAGRRGMVLLAAFLGWMFDGLEMGIFPLIARPALQQMQANHGIMDDKFVGHWMGWVTAAFLLGAAGGGLLFGWLGDKVGRVRAMSMAILCYSIFTGLVYFAAEPWHLAALRFVAALGMGGEWALGVALVMEVWPEKNRPMLAGIIGAAANIGFALIATVGMFYAVTQETWRYVVVIGALPAALTFFVRLFVPESEKWQHAAAAKPTQPMKEIFSSPALIRPLLIATLLASVALIGTWGSVQWLPLWADKMAGPDLPKAKAYTQFLSALGSVFGCLLGAWMGGKFGRRPAYFLLCLVSLISCAWLFRGIDSYGASFLTLTFVVGTVTAAFYGWMPLYLPELFPTRVRATAQGLSFNAGRILAAVGALQMGALMQTFDGSYAQAGAVISLIYVFGLVLIWFAPETRGKPLPE
ncbi:Putative niacin/nicotinamide transporter NaiP [Lacunisphaera limnophila]|uniref:Niacin/nicotinamide transporter NaiP n=1 Tax=Lacunisphaera limnophila TaxID=1838286 RepID=A0A1D8AWB4_9BACT|nr:MFS transporter [Lacunisphaera limnophila]AOS45177.1 Putative niacin/nicotinamide transporter NaiP [Lacunisphaera limnophila]